MADDRVRCCRGRRPGCEADAGGQPERHKQARHGHGFLNCWSTTLSRTMNPVGTTKECAVCGVETAKLIWVRERSCPACGHTEDCDLNAAKNILSRGLKKPGVGRSESASVQTALAPLTPHREAVSAKRVHQTSSGGLSDAV